MIAKTCIHPIKANKIIKAFIEEVLNPSAFIEIKHLVASPLMYYAIYGDIDDDEIAVYVPNWKIANYNNDFGGKCFRKDFVNRCPMAKGFSDVTISLLHEIGHPITRDTLPQDYCRWEECDKVNEIENTTERVFAYFKMLDETLATDWAIDWLKDAEHRKMAKAFEKKFFTCFK